MPADPPDDQQSKSRLPLAEAKRLVRRWDRGSFATIAQSIRYHHEQHGTADVWSYLKKANAFDQAGARMLPRGDGSVRWLRRSGEFLITRNNRILSYGVN